MSMYDTNDIIDKKKQNKRRKTLIRVLIILVLILLGAAAFFTKDLWLQKLRGLGTPDNAILNDGVLAEGNFPIEINGGVNYEADYVDGMIAVLSDAYIYMYSEEGGLINRRQHVYTNAVMNTAADKILLYESGGSQFSIEDRNGIIYEKKLEQNIIFARISKEGFAAVVTSSDNYECEVIVFDRRGEIIYQRKCIQKVNDISFTNESSGCIISYIYAENGSLVTSVQEAVFTESAEKWTSPSIDTFGLEVYNFDNGVFVLGIEACGYVDKTGQIRSLYRYDGDFAGGESSNGLSAVIVNSDDRRKYTMTLFNGEGAEPLILNFETPLIDVTVNDGLAYVMTQDSVLAYDFEGNLRSTATVNDSYTGFIRSKNYVFLKSFSKIDRIDYQS